MSATLSVITDGGHEEEPPEYAIALEDVYQTLKDTDAPDEKAALRTYIDARREALVRCWQLAEHRTRNVEQRRQGLVAAYGDYPHIGGLLLDCVAYQEVEEVQWRALRALVQLAYDNPQVSWLLLHNWVKEARQLAKEEDKIYADLREQVKKDVANVDDNLRARAKAKKEEIDRMKGRPMGPAALMTAFAQDRSVSWRVKECAFHLANNMANSCWDAHDIILKDEAVKTACATIERPDTPEFVVSAAVGFLCSLSYRPASRKPMLDQGVVPALSKVILKDSPEVNSMSAVLVVANVAGHLPPALCPALTKDMQISIKSLAALQATLSRQAFGGRFGTLWKVTMSVSALADGVHNQALLASNGVGSLLETLLRDPSRRRMPSETLLREPNVNMRAQDHACRILLQLAFNPQARELVLKDAPGLEEALSSVREAGSSALSRASAEAVLWALDKPPPPPPPNEDGNQRKHNYLMISHQTQHHKHAECIADGMRRLGYKVVATGPDGIPRLSRHDGVAGSGITMVILSEELQTSPLSRAEVTVAAAEARPVVWLEATHGITAAPASWLHTLPRAVAFGAAGAALTISMTDVAYDSVSKSLQPRDAATALLERVAEVVSRYIQPQLQSEMELEAARIAAEKALMAERVAQTTRKTEGILGGATAKAAGPQTGGGAPSASDAASVPPTPSSVASKVPLQVLLDFSVEQVGDWFAYNLGLPQYRDILAQNSVDGLLLVELGDDDLESELRIDDELHRSLIVGALKDIVGEVAEGRQGQSRGALPISSAAGNAANGDAAAAS